MSKDTSSSKEVPNEDKQQESSEKKKTTDLSAKYAQWERLSKEVEKEEEEEADGVDKLFKNIYRDSSDEVKKAMIKSFSESQGTVLSTNWNDVKKTRVDVKPPDGSEFKPYEK